MAAANPPPPRERDDLLYQKKRKLSSPPSMAAAEENPIQRDALFDASHKVYLFALVEPMSFKDRDIYVEDVYVLDLYPNAEGNPNPNPNSITVSPALRFKSDFPVARIVVDSKLYLFEGVENFRDDAKSVHVYDFSPSASSSYLEHVEEPEVVLIDKMDSLPSMHGFKLHPSAILTPNRRSVLVFSTFVKQFTMDPDPESAHFMMGLKGIVDFELFDLVSKSWLQLPSLPDLPRASKDEKSIFIQSYYFKGATTFVVRSEDSITFSLDLEDLDKGWEVCGKAMTPSFNGEVVAVGDALAVCMNVGVYDVAGDFCYYLPENPNVKKASISKMAVLDPCLGGDWENQVCILDLDYETDGDPVMCKGNTTVYPEIFIDVYELKSVPHSGGKFSRPILTPTKKRSHKFDLSVAYWTFILTCMLPARASTF